jgi:hypothetical protein
MKQRSYLTLVGQWPFHCNFLVGNVQLSDMLYSYGIQIVTTTTTTTWWNIIFMLRSSVHKEQHVITSLICWIYRYFNAPCKCCSRTLVTCWTTTVLRRFLFFKPRIYSCPSRRDNLKSVQGLSIWKFCLALCLQNVWFILMKNLATFSYVVDVFVSRKFKLIFENFKLVSQRK